MLKQESNYGPGTGCGDLDGAEVVGARRVLKDPRRQTVPEGDSVLSRASDLEHWMSTCVRIKSPHNGDLGHVPALCLTSL